MSASHDDRPGPFESPCVAPYLTGVYLVVNGIADVYLVVDGPNCVFFRIPQVQANHDWQADLARTSSLHRIVDTDATPTRASAGDTALLVERIRRVDALPDCAAILVTAMASVAITGRQYDTLLRGLEPPLVRPVIRVPEGSLSGDWVDGYGRTLEALAAELPLAPRTDPGPVPRVAVVGHLYHRNEGDVRADVAELRRLVAGLGLEAISLWPDGGGCAGLQAAGSADLVLSLPYARRAAARLAERLGVPVVEAPLPVGLAATERLLLALGEAAGRMEAAEELIAAELGRWVPRLWWVLAQQLLGRRIAVVADGHLAPALREALEELGCEVPLEVVLTSGEAALAAAPALPPASRGRVVAPSRREIVVAMGEARKGSELAAAVICSEAVDALRAGGPTLPFVEVGFPSYYSHALHPMPLLGYEGLACLVTRLINEIRHSEATASDLSS